MCYPDFSAKFTGDGTAGLFLVSLLSGVNLRDSLLNHSKNDLWCTACIQLAYTKMCPQNIKCSLGGLWGKNHILFILGGKKREKISGRSQKPLFSSSPFSSYPKRRLSLNGTNAKIKLLPHPPSVM